MITDFVESRRKFGVVGGLGPLASADVWQLVDPTDVLARPSIAHARGAGDPAGTSPDSPSESTLFAPGS
jgi:hypothetical protein